MATVYASASGNWSTMTWWATSTGTATTSPTSADTVDLNGKTVTVDTTITVLLLQGAGTLAVSGNQTINAACGTETSAWTCSLGTGGQTVTVNGTIRGGTATKFTVAGSTLLVNGDVYGGAAGSVRGVLANSGTLTIVGNLYASPGGSGSAAVLPNGATVTITGNATSSSSVVLQCQAGTTVLNGNVLAGAATCVTVSGGTLTINGSVTGSATSGVGAYGAAVNGGTLNVNGTITAGTGIPAGLGTAPFGVEILGGVVNAVGNLVDQAKTSAVAVAGGTLNYAPTNSQTATIGGKTLYPTTGGPIGPGGLNGGLQ